METKKKNLFTTGLAVALAALLLIGGGTFAYLQSSTGDTVNTFDTNKVMVELKETTGENYNIIPGTTQDKDPKVTVNNTVDAYVYVKVTDTTEGLVDYTIADGWTPLAGVDNVYYQEVSKGTEFKDISVLKGDKVTYSAALENNDMLDENGNLKTGIKLTFSASAVQKEPFNDPVKAYYKADVVVDTEEDLKDEIKMANDGDVIAMQGSFALEKPLTIDKAVTLTGDENTVISEGTITTNADVTFENITFAKPENTNKNATLVYGKTGTTELVFDGCTFTDPQWEAMQITSNDFKSLVVNNCTFNASDVHGASTSSYGNADDQAIRYIHIQPSAHNEKMSVTITNNTFNDIAKVKDSIVGIYFVKNTSTITVGGNTFNGWAQDDVEDGVSGKLSVGWPEVETLKTVSLWEGAPVTYIINGNLQQ